MWDEGTTAPAPGSSSSPLQDFFTGILGAAGKRIDQELTRTSAQQTFNGGNTTPRYGVNELGQPYFAGKASFATGAIAGVPAPLILVGVGILAAAFLLHGRG